MSEKKQAEVRPKIPTRTYIEHFLVKYRELSSADLAMLISDKVRSGVPFSKTQSSVAAILNKLKKEGKIEKGMPTKWRWKFIEE